MCEAVSLEVVTTLLIAIGIMSDTPEEMQEVCVSLHAGFKHFI